MRYIYAALLAVLLSTSGCILAAMQDPTKAMLLTPEQIRAYQELNVDIVFCLNVGGPPPAGNTTFILLPKGSKFVPTFGDGCHVIQGVAGITDSVRVPFNASPLTLAPAR